MRWQLALAQHPMYLLIREDTECAERTPPWGAPTIEAYIERVSQNLAALDRYPNLKLGYEWSAVELEILSQDSPEVFQKMRRAAQEGRVRFYNGTYGQPHLQILSGESNLRQFQVGGKAYQELGLDPVNVYAHQEASVHDQVPQILQAAGISFAAVPGFLTSILWLDPHEMILHGVRGPRFLQGDEFTFWQGLDGSQTPLYLHQPIPREMTLRETLARETVLRQHAAPTLFIDLPDMIPIDDTWMAEREAVDFVTLDEELSRRWDQYPAKARARLLTNWSYLEGIRAEELSRRNNQAEQQVLLAESLNAIAWSLGYQDSNGDSTDQIWKTILKCQHHDVYCFSAPGLRDISIQWLSQAAEQAQELSSISAEKIISQISTDNHSGQPLVVFNRQPYPLRQLVKVETEIPAPTVSDESGQSIPRNVKGNSVTFSVDLPGLGYSTFWIQPGSNPSQVEETRKPIVFKNDHYQLVCQPDGSFSSLVLAGSQIDLLNPSATPGNFLTATDSSQISFHNEDVEHRVDRYLQDPIYRGPALTWKATSPALQVESSLGLSIEVAGSMGHQIKARIEIQCYHEHPRIDLSFTFEFDQASIGTFFDDPSKLLLSWPLAFPGKIFHDIPFGVVEKRRDIPFTPITWTDYSDGEIGLAFFQTGAHKYWMTDQSLSILLAWGENTDAIHNSLGRYQWLKAFDQRLSGEHTINFALFPHRGDWRSARLPWEAQAFAQSPAGFLTDPHPGKLPPSLSLLDLSNEALLASSTRTEGDRLISRFVSLGTQPAFLHPASTTLKFQSLRNLKLEGIDQLAPFQIGEIDLGKNKDANVKIS